MNLLSKINLNNIYIKKIYDIIINTEIPVKYTISKLNKEMINKSGKSDVRIYPKSMILIPGKYKDCECLLLALKPETGVLDVHKSRESINDVSMLFSEIEEFIERPELDMNVQEQLLQKFANRFGTKLYGQILEDKWNKKMVGLSDSLPTGKEMITNYGTVKSDINILSRYHYIVNM